MKKLKVLATCALAVGVLSAISLTSLAATSASFNLYYTGTSVGSVLSRTYTIDGSSKKYKATCTSSSNGASIKFSMPGASDLTLDQNSGTQYIVRSYSASGNTTVKGSILHGSSSCGVIGNVKKA